MRLDKSMEIKIENMLFFQNFVGTMKLLNRSGPTELVLYHRSLLPAYISVFVSVIPCTACGHRQLIIVNIIILLISVTFPYSFFISRSLLSAPALLLALKSLSISLSFFTNSSLQPPLSSILTGVLLSLLPSTPPFHQPQ